MVAGANDVAEDVASELVGTAVVVGVVVGGGAAAAVLTPAIAVADTIARALKALERYRRRRGYMNCGPWFKICTLFLEFPGKYL